MSTESLSQIDRRITKRIIDIADPPSPEDPDDVEYTPLDDAPLDCVYAAVCTAAGYLIEPDYNSNPKPKAPPLSADLQKFVDDKLAELVSKELREHEDHTQVMLRYELDQQILRWNRTLADPRSNFEETAMAAAVQRFIEYLVKKYPLYESVKQ